MVFGGINKTGDFLSDLYTYSSSNSTNTSTTNGGWELVKAGKPPYPRAFHDAVVYDDWLVIFSGLYKEGFRYNETWAVNLKNEGKQIFWGGSMSWHGCIHSPKTLIRPTFLNTY